MSWYQENKFAGTLLGVTAVVSGVFIYLGMSANSAKTEAAGRQQVAVNKINMLQAAKPYPSLENEKLLGDRLSTFAVDTKKFQDDMLAFRPDKLPKLNANQFTAEVSKYVRKLTGYYRKKGVIFTTQGKQYFGMDKYADIMVKVQSPEYLNFHREALDWLFVTLADSGIEELNHVYRAPVAEALGEVAKPMTKKEKRDKKRRNAKGSGGVTSVSDQLPIEITFTGTEASLQKFLTDVTASEQYFFAVKLMKIQNEDSEPVVISKSTFAKVEEGLVGEGMAAADDMTDDIQGFDFNPGGAAEMEEDKDIIKQVIGDERITAFVQLDLILMKETKNVPIPRLEKEKTAQVPAKKIN